MSKETNALPVIENEAEIKAAHQQLAAAFRAGASIVRRTVNFPGPSPGYPDASLGWHPSLGVWVFFPDEPRRGKSGLRTRYCSFFGVDLQGSSVAPIVEINLGEHRHPSGRVFRDGSGRPCIGHRGRLGGGRANVTIETFQKEAVDDGFAIVTLTRSDGAEEDAIFIGRLDGESVAKEISRFVRFCAELRARAKTK